MDMVKEVMDLGLGVLALSKEKADKIAAELKRKGRSGRKEGKALLEDLLKKGKDQEKDFEKNLSKLINEAFNKLDIATKDDIRRLEARISKMKSRKG